MDAFQAYQQADKWKTLLEHAQIIFTYQNTGKLDREHAISVYCDFSAKNPDYLVCVLAEAAIMQNGIELATASDDQIVYNLNQQVLYLSGKSLWEGLRNGKQTGTDMVWQG